MVRCGRSLSAASMMCLVVSMAAVSSVCSIFSPGGVFEFGSASAEGAVGGEVVAELGADGVFDAEVSAFLGGSEALVGEDADEGEAGGVVGGGVGGFGVGVGYEGGSGEFGASGGDPAVTSGLSAGDLLEFAVGKGGTDAVAAGLPGHAVAARSVRSMATVALDLIWVISGSAGSAQRVGEAMTGLTGRPVRRSTASAAS